MITNNWNRTISIYLKTAQRVRLNIKKDIDHIKTILLQPSTSFKLDDSAIYFYFHYGVVVSNVEITREDASGEIWASDLNAEIIHTLLHSNGCNEMIAFYHHIKKLGGFDALDLDEQLKELPTEDKLLLDIIS